MKNKLKKFIISLFLILTLTLSVGCSSSNLLDHVIKNTKPTNYSELMPKNGVDGKDGKDGDNINLYEIYQQLIELNEFSGSYSEFVKEYLNSQNSTLATNKALNGTVSVYSAFTSTITYRKNISETATYTTKYYGAGSGVIFRLDKSNGDAYIITNYHVVYDSDADNNISQEISLFLYGRESFSVQTISTITDYYGNSYAYKNLISNNKITATYLGGSLLYDIAVLKVSNNEILKNCSAEAVYFADSNEISVGETAIAVGNPSTKGLSATKGIVSVDSEYITMLGVDGITPCTFRVIRTDAAVNPGNSGGGLFNTEGDLIGIINSKINSSSIENIGYAIPSNVVNNVAENIIRNCDGEENTLVKRCIIGINVVALKSSAEFNGIKTIIKETVAISNVNPNSAAYGLFEVGDIITSVTIAYKNSQSVTKNITRTFHLIDLSLTLSVGDTITINLTDQNGNEKSSVSITYTENDIEEYM